MTKVAAIQEAPRVATAEDPINVSTVFDLQISILELNLTLAVLDLDLWALLEPARREAVSYSSFLLDLL